MYTQEQESRQLDLFSPSRLARKPFCSFTKDHSYIRPLAAALRRPYIQPNSPTHFYRIVIDLDYHQHATTNVFGVAVSMRDIRLIHREGAWTKELGVPPPSWLALSFDKNSAHAGFEIGDPVARHAHARLAPVRYLEAVERGLTEQMCGDSGYVGLLCKNPLSSSWELLPGRPEPYKLSEFGHYFDFPAKKKANRTPRGEVGRAMYIFDEVRFWAYDNITQYRSGSFEAWSEAVLRTSEAINAAQYQHLPLIAGRDTGGLVFAEVKSAARSVARWTWANYGNGQLSQAFKELQAYRGTKGAAAAATVKRDRTEQQIIEAIRVIAAQGQIPTLRAVARHIGKSPSGLSMHYRDFFKGTMQ